ASLLPELLGDVRRERSDECDQGQHFVAMRGPLAFAHDVDILHHRRDRGVVAETRNVLADFTNRLVQLAHHAVIRRAFARHRLHRCEETVKETSRAGDARIPEIAALLVRTEEHEIGAKSIGAPGLDVFVGIDDVALRLRHLRAFTDDVTVRAEAGERLLEVEDSRIAQRHRDETRVEKVQYGVLVTANVRSYRQPLFGDFLLEGNVVVTNARVTQEIPRVVEEIVGHVGLATTVLAALWTSNAVPLFMACQR